MSRNLFGTNVVCIHIFFLLNYVGTQFNFNIGILNALLHGELKSKCDVLPITRSMKFRYQVNYYLYLVGLCPLSDIIITTSYPWSDYAFMKASNHVY